MAESTSVVKSTSTESYAGATRFEIELEFVQSLSNPHYLHYLALEKYLDDDAFVAYLRYLQYFQEPKYLKYLQFPGPTLRALELLQQPRFRHDMVDGNLVAALRSVGFEAATAGLKR